MFSLAKYNSQSWIFKENKMWRLFLSEVHVRSLLWVDELLNRSAKGFQREHIFFFSPLVFNLTIVSTLSHSYLSLSFSLCRKMNPRARRLSHPSVRNHLTSRAPTVLFCTATHVFVFVRLFGNKNFLELTSHFYLYIILVPFLRVRFLP